MRRRNAIRLLLFCLLCAGAAVILNILSLWRDNQAPIPCERKVLGTAVVDIALQQGSVLPEEGVFSEAPVFLRGKERKISESNPGVCFEGSLLPYDRQGICYLSQDLSADWTGSLTVAPEQRGEYFLCLREDPYLDAKQDAMKSNYVFTLYLVGESDYYELGLVICGMPVIAIDTEREEVQEEVDYEVDPDRKYFGSETLYYGSMEVFNAGVNTDDYEIVESRICYHFKGGMAKTYEKKSYSFHVQDYREQDVNVSLLGMRADSTWKLNSLVTDPNRIREMTAAQIWEQFDAYNEEVSEPGPRMEYVELVVDNEYQGLYSLVEPVDERKLALGKGDVLYKIIGDTPPLDEDIQTSVDRGWKIQESIRVRYPKTIADYGAAWYPIRDYLNVFYREDGLVYERDMDKIELSNLIDNYLFLMTAAVSDNCFKNSYYAAITDRSGRYTMYRFPWDLDLSFGNLYDVEVAGAVRFEEDVTCVYEVEELTRLKEACPQTVGEALLEKWQRCRQGFLQTENIEMLMSGNRDYLLQTGALERENGRWPQSAASGEIDYLLEYQKKRMEWLDEYFENWNKEQN